MTAPLIWLVIVVSCSGALSSSQIGSRQPVSSLLEDAGRQISAGRLDQAEKELQSVLHSAPGECRALDLMGVVRVLQGREKDAETLFGQALKKQSDFAPAHAHLGLLYLQLGREKDAVRELRDAVRFDPGRLDASNALVQILEGQAQSATKSGDWGDALALLKEASKIAPDNPDIQYEFGIVALRLSLDEDAVEAFQQTLKLRGDDALAVYNLGRSFMELSKFDDARQQFARYVGMRPDDPSGYCALGMTLAALEQTDEARTQFERSIALAPAQTESYYRLGLLDLESKDYETATRHLRQVLDHEPGNGAALTALGKVKFEQKSYADAVPLLQQAINNDDSLREAHYYLGLALARMGLTKEADEQLEIAARLEHEEAQQRRTILRVAEPRNLENPKPLGQQIKRQQ